MVGVVSDAITDRDVFVYEGVPSVARGLIARCPSVGGVVVRVRVEEFEAGSAAVGFAVPLATVKIGDLIRRVAVAVLEDEGVTAIAQLAGIVADDGDSRMFLSEGGGVFGDYEVAA